MSQLFASGGQNIGISALTSVLPNPGLISFKMDWLDLLALQGSTNNIFMIFPLKFFIKETVIDFIFLCSKITADGDCGHEAKRCLLLGKKRYDKSRQCIKTQRHYFADKGPQSEGDVFSSGHVWM